MEAAQDMTVDLETREQFDKLIGVLRCNTAPDNLAAIEMCRSLIYQAAGAIDDGGGARTSVGSSSQRRRHSRKSAIQMYKNRLYPRRYRLYLKRAMALAARYGNAVIGNGMRNPQRMIEPLPFVGPYLIRTQHSRNRPMPDQSYRTFRRTSNSRVNWYAVKEVDPPRTWRLSSGKHTTNWAKQACSPTSRGTKLAGRE